MGSRLSVDGAGLYFDYLSPRHSLTYDGQQIGQRSPGERGLLLLVSYPLVDKDDIPIVINQPEENLDNQTIYRILVKCVRKAKERRQVIMLTHNPNLAVVCDAEQIIYASCDKAASRFDYEIWCDRAAGDQGSGRSNSRRHRAGIQESPIEVQTGMTSGSVDFYGAHDESSRGSAFVGSCGVAVNPESSWTFGNSTRHTPSVLLADRYRIPG